MYNHLVVFVFIPSLNPARLGCLDFRIDMLDVYTFLCLTLAALLDSSQASPPRGRFLIHNAIPHLPLPHGQFQARNVVPRLLRAP